MENVVLFDLNEIDNKRNKTLQKSTNLIQKAKHSLTAKELTLVDFMVTNVKETDDDFFTIETTIAELKKLNDDDIMLILGNIRRLAKDSK